SRPCTVSRRRTRTTPPVRPRSRGLMQISTVRTGHGSGKKPRAASSPPRLYTDNPLSQTGAGSLALLDPCSPERHSVMEPRPLGQAVSYLRQLAAPADGSRLDAELIERFVASSDEAAFVRLVERHGPLVLGVCRRILQNHHDAEDAFQATFLVLARKA